MTTAIIGLLGVIVGLAVGRGYTFWATRRSELADAVAATAVLSQELRALTAPNTSIDGARLAAAWSDQRRALVVHMSPEDFQTLADSLSPPSDDAPKPFAAPELLTRVDKLTELFWEEHEAFILVPFIHYLTGNTLSKRIRATLDPDTNISAGSTRNDAPSSIRRWHRPPPTHGHE